MQTSTGHSRRHDGTPSASTADLSNAVLLVAGDKAGNWKAWYRQAIPLAEQRYEDYLKSEGTR